MLLTSDITFIIRYGCPGMEELESFSQEYKKRLDEVGALGEIPSDLALEVIELSPTNSFFIFTQTNLFSVGIDFFVLIP